MRSDQTKYLLVGVACVVFTSGAPMTIGEQIESRTSEVPYHSLLTYSSSAVEAKGLDLISDTAETPSLISDAARFRILADDWMDKTEHESSVTRAILHPSHIKIMLMNKTVVLPMIFAELRDRGGHWYWALQHLTGVTDIGERGDSLAVVKGKWLEWARAQLPPLIRD